MNKKIKYLFSSISGLLFASFFLAGMIVPAPALASTKGGVKPGDVFYSLDIFFEKFDLSTTFNSEKKIKKILVNNEERLAEAGDLIIENKHDVVAIKSAMDGYRSGVESVIAEAEKIEDKEKSKMLLSEVNDSISEQKEVIVVIQNAVLAIEMVKDEKGTVNSNEQEEVARQFANVQRAPVSSMQAGEEFKKTNAPIVTVAGNTTETHMAETSKMMSEVSTTERVATTSPVHIPNTPNTGTERQIVNEAIPAVPNSGSGSGATHAVPATPEHFSFVITVTRSAGGTISPETISVDSGSNQTFTITPSSGYQIEGVAVDGVSQGTISTYTFTNVTVAHTITATFIVVPVVQYEIVVTQGTNGTIFPVISSVASGGSQSFTITPASGYQISSLVADGTDVASTGTYTFTNVTATHTLSAVFSVIPPQAPAQVGRFNSSMCELAGIAVKSGLIYVTEQSHQMSTEYVCTRVRILTTSGDAVRTIGNQGDGLGEFSMPKGIDVGSSGKIYVADDFSHNIIQIFSSDATSTSWSSFSKPNGVAVGASGVYVADYGNDKVKKMDSAGNLLLQWGSYGFGNGQFNSPNDVAVDGTGNVYVLETASNRVQKFTADGQFIWMIGFTGPYGADISAADGYFSNPRGIGVDSSGNLYVADTGNHRVQKFNSAGQFILSWGLQGSGDGQFILPTDVAVDEDGYIYVANGAGSDFRIQKFK